MNEHGLGRVPLPDPRDRAYPMASVLPATLPGVGYRYWWQGGWWGDQGAQPHCVAYAWLHWIADGPITGPDAKPFTDPRSLYCRAQQLDPWPGDCSAPQYDGTATRSGAQALQELGLIGSYHWAFDLDTVVRALLTTGPVVVGTAWYEGMSRPGPDHVLRPTGALQGGHAYLLNGVNVERRVLRMKNSWGRHWGKDGTAWLGFDDFAALLADGGEAVLAVEQRPA